MFRVICSVSPAHRAVVGGEYDDGVLIPTGLAKGFHDAANGSVFVQIGAIWIYISPRSVKLFEIQREAEGLAG